MKGWHYVGLGVVGGVLLVAAAVVLLRQKLLTGLRGNKPLPGNMDATLEAFMYDMIGQATSAKQ